MSWIWLNMPFALVIVAFTVGLPLWVIIKHPEGGTSDASVAQVPPHAQAAASIADGEASTKVARDSGRRAA
jgi:hypothetical protein